MQELISPCQSAFIKGRSIHDNFLYVRNIARRFHRNGTPSLLLKLDISKSFDSVRWDYLLSLMQHRGFPQRWINWIAATLSTSTSRILVNGFPTDPILHGRGLRQGDPYLHYSSSSPSILYIGCSQRPLNSNFYTSYKDVWLVSGFPCTRMMQRSL